MVSIWLTTVKAVANSSGHEKNRLRKTKPVFIKSFGSAAFTADIAGSGWAGDLPDHADRWKTARKGIRRPSTCSGCRPPQGKANLRGQPQRLRPCGGSPTVWCPARAGQQLLKTVRQAR